MLENLEKLLKQVDNRARFLSSTLSGDIKCINMKKNELRQELIAKGFDPLPKEVRPADTRATGVKEENDADAGDYDYLTSMSVSSLTEEYLQHLRELKRRLEIRVGPLRKAAAQCLKSHRDAMVDMAAKDSQVSEAAPMRQRKRAAAESLETSAVPMDDDDEEAPELKDQLQEQSETECSQKQEQRIPRRQKRRKKSSERGARRALDFQGDAESGDGFLVEEIKRIASGLDGIQITRRNTDHSTVAHELGKISLRDASFSLRHEGVL